jgi:hypothetical protein
MLPFLSSQNLLGLPLLDPPKRNKENNVTKNMQLGL